jgi:hypothetical protein
LTPEAQVRYDALLKDKSPEEREELTSRIVAIPTGKPGYYDIHVNDTPSYRLLKLTTVKEGDQVVFQALSPAHTLNPDAIPIESIPPKFFLEEWHDPEHQHKVFSGEPFSFLEGLALVGIPLALGIFITLHGTKISIKQIWDSYKFLLTPNDENDEGEQLKETLRLMIGLPKSQ